MMELNEWALVHAVIGAIGRVITDVDLIARSLTETQAKV
jgi:hypothetical protein